MVVLHVQHAFWCNFLSKSAKRRREIFIIGTTTVDSSENVAQNCKFKFFNLFRHYVSLFKVHMIRNFLLAYSKKLSK